MVCAMKICCLVSGEINLCCHQGITDLLPSVVVLSPVEVELLLKEP